ncbi:MAG: S-adenosyl-l-methionine hydroxide adenosyltransferase family protein [Bacteroidales bacterium]
MSKADSKPSFVTLITDWGQHDYYCGMLKGRIVSTCSNIQIVDISHSIPSFNIHHAAFVLKHSYHNFPKGTIHVVLVNTEDSEHSHLLLLEEHGHFFVLPDNGMLGLLFNTNPDNIFQAKYNGTGSFASLDGFVNIIKKLNDGEPIHSIGQKTDEYSEKIALRATIDDAVINGSIIYIDSYKNVITNISRSLFDRISNNRNFKIYVQSKYNMISKISDTYNQVDQGELFALFNSANLLEIGIRNGYAAELLNLGTGGNVRIDFLE